MKQAHNSPHMKLPGKGQIFMLGAKITLLALIARMFLFIYQLIRWLFAPIVLLLQLVLMMPFAKTMSLSLVRRNFRQVDAQEIPDAAWIYFQEMSAKLRMLGFKSGPCVRYTGITNNQTNYAMTMVNPDRKLGLGLNYIIIVNAAGATVAERTYIEMTAECGDRYIDFTNNEEVEPFTPSNRLRMSFPHWDELQLLRAFNDYTAKYSCTLTDALIHQLMDEPDTVMWEELSRGMENLVQQGFLTHKPDKETLGLTWKGAFYAGVLVQWPLSVPARKREEKIIKDAFEQVELDIDNYDDTQLAQFLPPLPVAVNSSILLPDLMLALKPLFRGISDQLKPATISFSFSGDASTTPLDNIHLVSVLHEDFEARKLARHCECELEIKSDSEIDWITIDDNYLTPEEDDPVFSETQPLPVSVRSVLPLRKAIEITQPHIDSSQPCTSDYLQLIQDGETILWYRQTSYESGFFTDMQIDAMTGDFIPAEHSTTSSDSVEENPD